jgi:hypothetical protein
MNYRFTLQETDSFLQMIEKCRQKLSKEGEDMKMVIASLEHMLQNSGIVQVWFKRASPRKPMVDGRLVWHQACHSFDLTCYKLYQRKNKSRTVVLWKHWHRLSDCQRPA